MKKFSLMLMVSILIIFPLVTLVHAEEMQGMDGGEGRQAGSEKGGGKSGEMKKRMMMGMMNRPQVTATSDGGVVVLNGPKLTKYDKDLTLVNEVELKRPEPPKSHNHDHSKDDKEKSAGTASVSASNSDEQLPDTQ